jgi:hypothetical protein
LEVVQLAERIRKIGLKEMAEEAALRAIGGLLEEIETDITMIAQNIITEDPELYKKVGKYFRDFSENMFMIYTLLDLLLGEYLVFEDELEINCENENWGC